MKENAIGGGYCEILFWPQYINWKRHCLPFAHWFYDMHNWQIVNILSYQDYFLLGISSKVNIAILLDVR